MVRSAIYYIVTQIIYIKDILFHDLCNLHSIITMYTMYEVSSAFLTYIIGIIILIIFYIIKLPRIGAVSETDLKTVSAVIMVSF